ncbi:helix-turn-helix transcriptional regulator [Bacillus sp. PS194]|uniref:helix-turn-helix domain-containing protein n=1 Tax=Bacillus TaxID=1386 RepID=UPI00129DA38A|nr:helix-turn-helix transcriptional regulator [Bacillus subtilis]MBL3637591.1 helix-turn-helix transcriptional regulator [Alkalicoccobacillus gibsonii]QGI11412.1 helix-turn-helix domain-containing protein [Bacillus subtilis]QGI20014.1 helix-turn-helix domain-containing protein [Bacillus subtilis]WIY67830.1 helix-turn-helix transcriptional regulator [Bacillus subtilis]
MIKSNLKLIIDERKISIRKLSRDINHEYPTVRKLYNDEMERYPRELLDKVCTYLNIELQELLIFEKGHNHIDRSG